MPLLLGFLLLLVAGVYATLFEMREKVTEKRERTRAGSARRRVGGGGNRPRKKSWRLSKVMLRLQRLTIHVACRRPIGLSAGC